MDNAQIIRAAMERVADFRAHALSRLELGLALSSVKRLQASRFRTCYADLLDSFDYGDAARFFLDELYGDADYSQRDAQFARIAGTLATVFPSSVVATAVSLAQLHALTEELDHLMALECSRLAAGQDIDIPVYVAAWRLVGRRTDRQQQLEVVLSIGRSLIELTRKPGLAVLLKLMRKPAAHAGMASLQHFLELGFEIFGTMARRQGKASEFLSIIETREKAWINGMFDLPQKKCLDLFSELFPAKQKAQLR